MKTKNELYFSMFLHFVNVYNYNCNKCFINFLPTKYQIDKGNVMYVSCVLSTDVSFRNTISERASPYPVLIYYGIKRVFYPL